jgi:hypothetical protein
MIYSQSGGSGRIRTFLVENGSGYFWQNPVPDLFLDLVLELFFIHKYHTVRNSD